MKRKAAFVFLATLLGMASTVSRANSEVSPSVQSKSERLAPMSQDSAMIDLFNRWEQVWNESKFDLVTGCVADAYIRHDPKGDRTVTRDAYTAEVANIHKDRPDIRVIVLRSLVLRRSRLVPFCIRVDRYENRSGPNPSRDAGLPDRGRQTCRNMDQLLTVGHRLDGRSSGALDQCSLH